MSSEQPTFTRVCPQCGRRVPRRLTECRCGFALEGSPDVEEPSPGVQAASGSSAVLKWGIAAAAIVAVAATAVALSRTRTPVNGAPAVRNGAPAASSGPAAPSLPAEQSVPTPPVAEWPKNVPYLSSPDPASGSPVVPQPVVANATLATGAEMSLERIAAAVLPAVVLIETPGGRGTGFFVSSDTALTNAHVVEGSAYVTLQFQSGERASGRVTSIAAEQDLAIIRLASPRANLQPLPLGTLREIRVGQEVLAVGSPLGLQNTVTRGIVSALRRGGGTTLVQTDAAINPGNSGGPLIDRAGRVIAITTMKMGDRAESLGFAVAIDHARALLETGSAAIASPPSSRVASMDVGSSAPDATESVRTQGLALFERVMMEAGRRADALDDYWDRFAKVCLREPLRTGGDRAWFAIWERGFPTDAVSPACVSDFQSFRDAADVLRMRLMQADEAARRAGVYPGSRRELRERYRLDWDGWDR
jgi:S1-C subfamily serine protease